MPKPLRVITAPQRALQSRGFALGEMLLAVAIVAVLVGIGAGTYGNLRGGIRADDQGTRLIELASDIQVNWRNASSFSTLSGAEVNKIGLVNRPMQWDGTNMLDLWGNAMSLVGGTTSFVITIGGATNPMGKDDCAAIANRLGAGVAANISIGTTAAAATGASAGQVTGGNAYKVGSTITQSNLTTGCNEATTKIAASFR